MPTLKEVVESTDTQAGKFFDTCIQMMIVFSLITFSIETIHDLSQETRQWLYRCEIASVIVFTGEYLLRVFVATKKSRYMLSFFGIIDLAAILPFYIGTGIDLRSIRAFRMIRLFRLFKLARYSAAVRRFKTALNLAKEEVILFFSMTAILIYLASFGIYHFESQAQPEIFGSVFHAMWWAVATMTTVGYGDVFPITVGGKIFTAVMLFISLGVISSATGIVASALTRARELENQKADDLKGCED
ncbi:MAG TPA: ion transporter [Phycisphaerales bacterium]|mgnify:CR=1 FL=1|nr:ion transporter [Phycisphaerales bacterium]|tara:strand:+ start:438 stop:1172 length:735 start_codon:yes stop_codon:yes gene_type:complete